MNFAKTAAVCAALGLAGINANAQANLVLNGGFETGPNLFDWTTTNASSGSSFNRETWDPHTGSYSAFFGANGTGSPRQNDQITQTFSDVVGATYTETFWLGAQVYNNTYSTQGSFIAEVDATSLLGKNATGSDIPFAQYTYTFTGTGSDTILFSAHYNQSAWFLDDVSVIETAPPPVHATPEPGSVALLSGLFITGGAVLRRRLRK